MLEILFVEIDTARVHYAVTDVARVCHITPSEIELETNSRIRSYPFPSNVKIEVHLLKESKTNA